jgi:hypothetical protein
VAIHSIIVTDTSQLFQKIVIISGHHRMYRRVEQVAPIKEKAHNFTVYKSDSKNITDFRK